MAIVVYALCALTSIVCATVLLKSFRRSRSGLLLWCSFCFIGLALNNILLFIDVVLAPGLDLATPRTVIAFGGMTLLLYGLIWETV